MMEQTEKGGEPRPVAPLRRLRPRPQQGEGRQRRRQQRAPGRDEQGIELGDRHPRRRQRQAEHDDAEEREQQGLPVAAACGLQARRIGAGARHPRLPPSTLREITTRMISLVPSRIWCTRRSRTSFSRP